MLYIFEGNITNKLLTSRYISALIPWLSNLSNQVVRLLSTRLRNRHQRCGQRAILLTRPTISAVLSIACSMSMAVLDHRSLCCTLSTNGITDLRKPLLCNCILSHAFPRAFTFRLGTICVRTVPAGMTLRNLRA